MAASSTSGLNRHSEAILLMIYIMRAHAIIKLNSKVVAFRETLHLKSSFQKEMFKGCCPFFCI